MGIEAGRKRTSTRQHHSAQEAGFLAAIFILGARTSEAIRSFEARSSAREPGGRVGSRRSRAGSETTLAWTGGARSRDLDASKPPDVGGGLGPGKKSCPSPSRNRGRRLLIRGTWRGLL